MKAITYSRDTYRRSQIISLTWIKSVIGHILGSLVCFLVRIVRNAMIKHLIVIIFYTFGNKRDIGHMDRIMSCKTLSVLAHTSLVDTNRKKNLNFLVHAYVLRFCTGELWL